MLVCLVVLAAASAAASAAPPAAPPATGEVSVDLGREAAWAACRPTAKVTAAAISLPGVFAPGSPAVECVHGIAAAPATAFAVLQRNGTFTEVGIGTAHDDPFVDDMLYRAPDINASAGFYKLVWRCPRFLLWLGECRYCNCAASTMPSRFLQTGCHCQTQPRARPQSKACFAAQSTCCPRTRLGE